MADLNYYNTLITVAEDCPVDRSVVPTLGSQRLLWSSTRCLPGKPTS